MLEDKTNPASGLKKLISTPVFLEGALYAGAAVLASLNTSLGSEEAGKILSIETLFWLKTFSTAFFAGALALKMFRSTAYADSKNKQEAELPKTP